MHWRVRLFDGPVLESFSGQVVRRFRSQKVGALLAYLALKLGHPCPREELADALWPDELDQQVVANRLRVALASLRRQLEPSGVPFGSVLDVSIPGCIRLNEETVWCDVSALESAGPQEAAQLAQGTFLPGNYEDWAALERLRLEALTEDLPPPQSVEAVTPEPAQTEGFPLPLYLTRYFGRENEIARLQTLLAENRLVTVTGPGGMGKTRLSVETVRRQAGPAIFAALADIEPEADIAESILRALHVAPGVEADLVGQIVAFLKPLGPVLLILDNAEHLVEPTVALAVRLLQEAPELRLLVTSRQRLNVAGEALLALGPLDGQVPAFELFVDRAQSVRPDFVVRAPEPILEICRLLEGMPLALELAAARVVAQTPAQIAEALSESLIGLKSRQRNLSPRHQSLIASIQGTYNLLDDRLKEFFRRLSMFQGGWTIEAARVVTGDPEAEWHLEDLVICSLVTTREDADGNLRYVFLEAIRQFAAEQLSPEERHDIAQRHAGYFLDLAAQVDEDDIATFAPLDPDQENLFVALEAGDSWSGLAGALIYGHVRGLHRAILPWAEKALAQSDAITDSALRTRVKVACYYVFSYVGRLETITAIGEDLARTRQDYLPGQIYAKLIRAYVLRQKGEQTEAIVLADLALAEARSIPDRFLICRCLRIDAYLHCMLLADDTQSTDLLLNGERLSRECLSLLPPSSSHLTFELLTLCYLCNYLGRGEEAYGYLKQAQRAALAHGMRSMLLFAIRYEGLLAVQAGHKEYAGLFFGAFLQLRESTGYNSMEMKVDNQFNLEDFPEELIQQGRRTPIETLVAMSFPPR